MNVNPAQYHRNSKKWRELLGKKAVVELVTTVFVAPQELEAFLPYQLLLVTIENKKIEIMGSAHVDFTVGEEVILELKKLSQPNRSTVIPYGIKASKIFK